MKPIAHSKKKKLPVGFKIKPGLDEKYANHPYFLKKAEEANKFIEKYGLPDFDKKHSNAKG